jgi:hypothetical protein
MKTKYFNLLVLLIMCLNFSLSHSQNVLTDGDFSSTTVIIPFDTPTPPINAWAFWVNYWGNGSDANPIVVDGVCNFQIINPGDSFWNVQLGQWGFPLIQGHSYQLSFNVKANADRLVGVYLGEDGGSYTNLIGFDRYLYSATTEWQTFIIDFEAFSVFNMHKLSFELGTDSTTTYFDNISLIDLGSAQHSIGIIGSALNGWSTDVDMQTIDQIIYTLKDYYFTDGHVKFRQDDSWNTNWGGDTFPSGYGIRNGPDISIQEGFYDVSFNRVTGEYSFNVITCTSPHIECPNTIYVENSPGFCGAFVDYPEITLAICGADSESVSIAQTSGLPSGSLFPVGKTTNVFLLTTSAGDVASCNFDVIVYDTEAPVISDISEYFEPLWPPNHKMVQVPIDYIVTDNCGTTTTELSITSNEPENGLGDGDQAPDWEILDEHNVLLRAERAGNGNGREYYISIKSYDDSRCTSLDINNLTVIFEEDFQTAIDNTNLNFTGWTNFAEEGDKLWTEQTFNGNGYTDFNSFQSGNDINIGWLVSPGIDMDAQDNEFLNFKTAQHHLTSIDNSLEVFISTDYDGSNVLAATWSPISAELASLNDSWYDYIDSGIIDISSYSGTLYVAFKVVGSGTDTELDGGYFVDDIKILACYNETGNYTEQQVVVTVPHDKGHKTGYSNKYGFDSKAFILYPNGVDDIINIKGIGTSVNSYYNIYDLLGVKKRSGILDNSQIDVRTLNQGIYMLKIETKRGSFFKRFIKN